MSILINTREIAAEYRLSHWAGVMRKRQESGQNIKAYCEQIGISANTYHYWQRRLRASACEALITQAEASTEAQPVVPSGWSMCEAEKPQDGGGSAIRIEIGKYRVSVGTETDPELLAKVCRTLAELC